VNSPRGDIALPAAAMKYETAATMRELDRCLRAAIGHSPHPEC
jgi:hypothetical protein